MPTLHPFFQIRKWWEWRLQSRSRYGVHSPFVFDLLTRGLQAPVPAGDARKMLEFRRQWLNDRRKINITDPGAGSHRPGFGPRRIRNLARTAGSSQRQMFLLYRLARYFRPARILELGTHLGIGTFALHCGAPGAEIITVEGSRELFGLAKENFEKRELKNIRQVFGLFDNVLPDLLGKQSFDMIVVDGNHRYGATLKYFEMLVQSVPPQGFVLWDDIRWSPGMWRAWEHIRRHPQVRLSLDLYRTGITFFDPSRRQKEHFALRHGRPLSFFGLFD